MNFSVECIGGPRDGEILQDVPSGYKASDKFNPMENKIYALWGSNYGHEYKLRWCSINDGDTHEGPVRIAHDDNVIVFVCMYHRSKYKVTGDV